MKKIYLLAFMGLGVMALAQTPVTLQTKTVSKNKLDYSPASPVQNNPNRKQRASAGKGYGKNSNWTVVGKTDFDRQTNASVYRRIEALPNNKVSVIWTTSTDGTVHLTRGTGYNHYDGTAWKNYGNNRIETDRTGYPSIVYDKTRNQEIAFAHQVDTASRSNGFAFSKNSAIGSNSWSSTTVLDTAPQIPGVLWARTAISGDYMFVYASYTDSSRNQPNRVTINGVRGPQVFSKYNLATQTWEVKNQPLPGYDSTRYYNGGNDSYAIDAMGSTVAVLAGGVGEDVALWKSNDNGTTWNKTIIDSFPIPAYNFRVPLDTTFGSDGAVSVILDNDGKAHCFWGLSRILDNDTAGGNSTFTSFPGQNDIMYWYEGRPDSIVSAAFSPEDSSDSDNSLGWGSVIEDRAQYGLLSITTAPYAVNHGDTIYLLYQSRTDNDQDGQEIAFTDIYVVYSIDNGASWSNPINLTSVMDFNTEQTFASAADDCATTLKITYLDADLQGFYDATNNANKIGPFDVVYYQIPVADLFAGTIIGLNENQLFSLDQNYPNPFNNSTVIPVNLKQGNDVQIEIVNMVGQKVYSQVYTNSPAGLNNYEISLPGVKPGMYFYTVQAGNAKVTRKMLVE